MKKGLSRRRFLESGTVLGAAFFLPQIFSELSAELLPKKKIRIRQGDSILFQGDSITDGARKRDSQEANQADGLGTGYPVFAAAHLLHAYAPLNLKIFNRGVSGDKVSNLAARWTSDTIQLKPSILSILVGVNDYWHILLGMHKGTATDYGNQLRSLIEATRKALPDTQLVIGEPFAVKGVKIVKDNWYPDFDHYREEARNLSQELDCCFIPYQSVFDKAIEKAPASYWTYDGVHTTLAGAQLMAAAWLNCLAK